MAAAGEKPMAVDTAPARVLLMGADEGGTEDAIMRVVKLILSQLPRRCGFAASRQAGSKSLSTLRRPLVAAAAAAMAET